MLRLLGMSVLLLIVWIQAPAAELAENKNLFFIKRSKNINEVHYDALVENCIWQTPEINAYWRRLEEGPDVVRNFGFVAKLAYGFDVDRASDTEIRISLKALPDRLVTARLTKSGVDGCKVSTIARINDEIAEVNAVYVFADGLDVQYVDILGVSQGKRVFERIIKTEQGEEATLPPESSRWTSGASQ